MLHENTAVLLIDAQPRFVGTMHGSPEPVLARLERLLQLADMLELPVIATFERPTQDKGLLPEPLEAALPQAAQRFEKSTFNCLADAAVRAALEGLKRRHVAVAGAETDVCVLLTVLALLEEGYGVHLLEDCVFTSERNVGPAYKRMYRAGAIPCTFKTLAYELTTTVDRTKWPASWRESAHLFPPPEDLP